MTPLNLVPTLREGDIVLDMNLGSPSEISPKLPRLRTQGADSSYFESQVKDVVVPSINALSRSVRSTSGVVAWVRSERRTYNATDWPVSKRRNLVIRDADEPSYEGLESFELLDGLNVDAGDHTLSTFSPNAFWGSALSSTLRNLQISDALITGCFTESAVVINAMDVTHTGLISNLVDDSCAGIGEQRHRQSIDLHSRIFNVMSTRDVKRQIEKE